MFREVMLGIAGATAVTLLIANVNEPTHPVLRRAALHGICTEAGSG